MEQYHIPVMLNECIEGLNIDPNGVYVDVTFGGGSHSKEILKHLNENGQLISFDQDSDALSNLIEDPKFTFIPENFKYLERYLKLEGIRQIDGLLADLGVSSHQFDVPERGFSFRFDADLDMRMNDQDDLTAKKVINEYSEKQLADIFYYYGEINNSRKIASIIESKRKTEKIESTNDLVAVIEPWIKGKRNRYLAQLFQALRMEVNHEMDALKEMLEQTTKLLKPGARLVVMTYHSIEDRIVKNIIKSGNAEGKIDEDFFGNKSIPYKKINKKPILPSEEEQRENPRSRSAKLRIAEKVK